MSQQEVEDIQQNSQNSLENQNNIQDNSQQKFNIEATDRWQAALKIQKGYRSYTNKKVYRYYRDTILFKTQGNPAKLLKAINPNEAQLLEAAANIHLRFRLGGENFPPNIYYKIFIHGSNCDINSFAPRDYSQLKKQDYIKMKQEKIYHNQYKQNKQAFQQEGWYLRSDNNGWRPISHKVLNKTDYIEVFSANQLRYHHFKKDVRQIKQKNKQRVNKLRWLQSMYKNAKKEEDEKLKNEDPHNQDELIKEYLEIPEDANPLKDDKFLRMDDDEFDDEVKDLIEWSNNLDYDSYIKDWFQLSTSNASENFVPKQVNQNVTLSSTVIDNFDKNNKYFSKQQFNNNTNIDNSNINKTYLTQQQQILQQQQQQQQQQLEQEQNQQK